MRAAVSSGINVQSGSHEFAACGAGVPGCRGAGGQRRRVARAECQPSGVRDMQRPLTRKSCSQPTISKLCSISVEKPLASSVATGTPVSPASANIPSAQRH